MRAFNSNTKKLNRVVPKTDINNITGASFIEKLVSDAQLQGETYSGSLATVQNYQYDSSFDSRTKQTFNTKNRTNPNQSKIKRSEKDLVLGFRDEILDRYFTSTLEYYNQYQEIKKSRSIEKLLDL